MKYGKWAGHVNAAIGAWKWGDKNGPEIRKRWKNLKTNLGWDESSTSARTSRSSGIKPGTSLLNQYMVSHGTGSYRTNRKRFRSGKSRQFGRSRKFSRRGSGRRGKRSNFGGVGALRRLLVSRGTVRNEESGAAIGGAAAWEIYGSSFWSLRTLPEMATLLAAARQKYVGPGLLNVPANATTSAPDVGPDGTIKVGKSTLVLELRNPTNSYMIVKVLYIRCKKPHWCAAGIDQLGSYQGQYPGYNWLRMVYYGLGNEASFGFPHEYQFNQPGTAIGSIDAYDEYAVNNAPIGTDQLMMGQATQTTAIIANPPQLNDPGNESTREWPEFYSSVCNTFKLGDSPNWKKWFKIYAVKTYKMESGSNQRVMLKSIKPYFYKTTSSQPYTAWTFGTTGSAPTFNQIGAEAGFTGLEVIADKACKFLMIKFQGQMARLDAQAEHNIYGTAGPVATLPTSIQWRATKEYNFEFSPILPQRVRWVDSMQQAFRVPDPGAYIPKFTGNIAMDDNTTGVPIPYQGGS